MWPKQAKKQQKGSDKGPQKNKHAPQTKVSAAMQPNTRAHGSLTQTPQPQPSPIDRAMKKQKEDDMLRSMRVIQKDFMANEMSGALVIPTSMRPRPPNVTTQTRYDRGMDQMIVDHVPEPPDPDPVISAEHGALEEGSDPYPLSMQYTAVETDSHMAGSS